jgi:hypothetical protein
VVRDVVCEHEEREPRERTVPAPGVGDVVGSLPVTVAPALSINSSKTAALLLESLKGGTGTPRLEAA